MGIARAIRGATSQLQVALMVLRLAPLYLIPAVLLWDHIRSASTPPAQPAVEPHGLFLLPGRAAWLAVAGVAGVALVTVGLAVHRRSDAAVRRLVRDHRESIREAAARYDVDPRLVASIVYVTHRDQLSPFRGALERLVIGAWARNLRAELGIRAPDRLEDAGTDESPLLNRALDVSVGLAQIKPRTAQTASVLATGRKPDDLPKPVFFSYRDVEPIGDVRALPAAARTRSVSPPIPVPADRHVVAGALLDDRSNLATVRAHPGPLSKSLGGDEPRLEHSRTSRHPGHALSDRLRALEAPRRAAQQRLRQPGTAGLQTAVALRAAGRASPLGAGMK